MSRAWIVVMVVVALGAMWLAVGRPSADEQAESDAVSDEPIAVASSPQKAVLQPPSPKSDAAAPEPEEPEEPAVYAPPPAAPTGPAPWPQGDLLAGSKGPVDEWQALYDRQARDSASTDIETNIRQNFTRSSRPDLLHSVSCREGVCKMLIRWAPDRAQDYIKSMRWLALGTAWPPGQPGFESQVAYRGASENDKDGNRLVEIYLKRRSPTASRNPSHPHAPR
jgi:hypothetical protein